MLEKPTKIYKDPAFYVGLVFTLFAFVGIGIGFDQIEGFIDIPSIAIVIIPTYGVLLIAYGFNPLLNAANIAVGKIPEDKNQALLAHNLCSLGMKVSLLSSILGMLIGMINMLSQGMDDPSVLTSGMAVALITNFYGILVCFTFFVAAGRVEKTYTYLDSLSTSDAQANNTPEKPLKKSIGYIVFFIFPMIIAGSILAFFVLIFSMKFLSPNDNQLTIRIINNSSSVIQANISLLQKAQDSQASSKLQIRTDNYIMRTSNIQTNEDVCFKPKIAPLPQGLDSYVNFVIINLSDNHIISKTVKSVTTEQNGKKIYQPLEFTVTDDLFKSSGDTQRLKINDSSESVNKSQK